MHGTCSEAVEDSAALVHSPACSYHKPSSLSARITMADQYVDRKTARASYRPKNVRSLLGHGPNHATSLHCVQLMSPGLKRAREPFRLRNALTGVALAGFAVGVWAYSIGAVKQDVFDDVDEEARALMAGSGIQKSEDGAADGRGATTASQTVSKTSVLPTETASPSSPSTPAVERKPRRGVLPPLLEHRLPRLLDPSSGTLVWGAPPIDNVGKLGGTSDRSRRIA